MSPPSLEIAEVDQVLAALASLKGAGSAGRRQEQLRQLFLRATAEEQEFLMNLILGNLRQGALEGLMVEALASAFSAPAAKVRRASMMAGDVPAVARTLAETGEPGLAQYDVQLFRPVHPMLAQPVADLKEGIALLGTAALEYKLDGARIQVHRRDDEVRVYTRALNEVTKRSRGRRGCPCVTGPRANPRWRSHQLCRRRTASALSSDDAAFRPSPGRRRFAREHSTHSRLVRHLVS